LPREYKEVRSAPKKQKRSGLLEAYREQRVPWSEFWVELFVVVVVKSKEAKARSEAGDQIGGMRLGVG
jgi:hypothetical protein